MDLCGRDHVPAAWTPVQAPFRSLRWGLADAEARLNRSPTGESLDGWQGLRDAAGDEQACLGAVKDLVAAVLAGWQLARVEGGHYRVSLCPRRAPIRPNWPRSRRWCC